MNKQEAIKSLQEMAQESFEVVRINGVHIDNIVEVISQIDEPQKVIIPEFVAEWYKRNKDDFESNVYKLCLQFNRDNGELSSELYEWFDWGKNEPIQTLVKMKLDGYKVEQEKLYTVEIPDPNSYYNYRFLSRNGNGVCIDASNHNNWKQRRENHLTESEIKKDFEWAWQWAEPVEEEEW